VLSPSSIHNFQPKGTEITALPFKPDLDSSLSQDSFLKREFKEEDVKRAPVLLLEVFSNRICLFF